MTAIPLSYSKISEYKSCPKLFYDKNVSKDYDFEKDKKSVPLIKGNKYHEALENYVKQRQAGVTPVPLPDEIAAAGIMADRILGAYPTVVAEMSSSLDKNWQPQKIDNWWRVLDGSDPYMRSKLDLTAIKGKKALLVDWKSGKFKDYSDSELSQLRMFAVVIMSMYPEIEEVETAYLYIEHQKKITETFYRKDYEALKRPFDEIAAEIYARVDFPATKNENCRWCSVNECQFKGKW
jgi:CRISPR/Cas system-associated exonuclease Cas4 (RecB family)